MLLLTKENLLDYVSSRLPFFDKHGEIKLSAVGEGSVEEDGDGFINFVFRISDGKYRLIVKQSRSDSISKAFQSLDVNRFRLEYDAMKIRKAIVPDLLPDLYDIDLENHVFITEDVSRLKISRFQLLKGIQFPLLGEQIGRYMAKTQFYTSVYYLDCPTFRDLSIRFMNTKMRSIMERSMFLTSVSEQDKDGRPLDPEFETFSRRICADRGVRLARQRLRHLYMSKGECLIHGDLHTSNIFADYTECKVIDMEYTFCGPMAYDMGYFMVNFIAQYAAATFRPFACEGERASYKEYCLQVICDTYKSFCKNFCECFDESAKEEYRNIAGLKEQICLSVLRESIGFGASAQLGRICNVIPYADYDEIKDEVQRHNAKCYSIILNQRMLLHYQDYNSIDEFIDDMKSIEKIYCNYTSTYDVVSGQYL